MKTKRGYKYLRVPLIALVLLLSVLASNWNSLDVHAACNSNKISCSKCGGDGIITTSMVSTQGYTPNGTRYYYRTTYSGCKTCGGSGYQYWYYNSHKGYISQSGSYKKGSGYYYGDHNWNKTTTISAATCTSNRTYRYVCGYCGTKGATLYTEANSALGHKNVNGGSKDIHTKCSRCGTTTSSKHSYTSTVQTAATCEGKGTTKYTCGCGYSYTAQDIAALGHKNVNGGTKDIHTKCSRCGTTTSSKHSYTSAVVTAATCEEKGTTKYTCGCGYSYTSQDIATLGHDYSGTKSSTYKNDGYWYQKCSNCNSWTKREAITYYIAFNSNNGTGSMDKITMTYDTAKNLSENAFTKEGHTFLNWLCSDGVTYNAGASVKNLTTTHDATVTMTAQWSKNQYTVTYDGNGGNYSGIKSAKVGFDDEVDLSPTATMENRIFMGWALTPDAEVCLTNYKMPANDIKLYAVYSLHVSDVAKAELISFNKNNTSQKNIYQMSIIGTNANGYNFGISGANLLQGISYNNLTDDIQVYIRLTDHAGNYRDIPIKLVKQGQTIVPDPDIVVPIEKTFEITTKHMIFNRETGKYIEYYSGAETLIEGSTFTPQYIAKDSADPAYPVGYQNKSKDPAFVVTKDATAYVYYEPIAYKMYFDPNGGSCDTEYKLVYNGDYIGELPVAEREGYEFLGWFTEKNAGTKISDGDKYEKLGDTTVYAHWKVHTNKVIYDYKTNLGQRVDFTEANVNYGENVNLTNKAYKDGWTFVGWNTNPDAETGLQSYKMPDKNLYLYAIYKKDIVATFIDKNDGGAVTRKVENTIYNKASSADIIVLEQNKMNGWNCLGWSKGTAGNADIDAASGATLTLTENVTFYGCYVRDIKVTYDTNGSQTTIPDDVKEQFFNAAGNYVNPEFTLADAPTLEKHSFVKWEVTKGKEIGKKYDAGKKVIFDQDTVLKAVWDQYPEIEAYDRYFTLEEAKNGGITPGRLFEEVIATDREDGILDNGTDVTIPYYDPDEFKSFTDDGSVTVTYKAEDSFGNEVTKTVTVYIVDTNTIDALFKTYVRFIDKDYYKKADSTYVEKAKGGLEENSKWKTDGEYAAALESVLSYKKVNRVTNTVTVLGDDKVVPDLSSGEWVNQKQTWTFNKDVIDEVEEFVDTEGYAKYLNEDAIDKFYDLFGSYNVENDEWKPYEFRVFYNPNGGNGEMEKSVFKFDVEAPLRPNIFTKTGHSFGGWNTKEDGTGVSYTDVQTVKNITNENMITLYAQWIPNTYTVYYNANGGTGTTAPSTHTYGVAKGLTPNGFTKANYVFTGWNTSADGSGFSYNEGAVLKNLTSGSSVTLYAQWTQAQKQLSIKHTLDGKEISDSDAAKLGTFDVYLNGKRDVINVSTYDEAIDYGTSYEVKDIKAKSGYLYTGNSSYTGVIKGSAHTITLTWETEKLTLTFDGNGGTPSETSRQLEKNAAYGKLPSATRAGYTFNGWNLKANGGGSYVDAETRMGDIDVTIYAQWKANDNTKYVVNHYQQDINGITVGTTYTLKEKEEIKGVSGTKVTPSVKEYVGFTAPKKQTVTISGDGTTVVNYYYARNLIRLDVSAYLDEVDWGTLEDYGTFDVYVNGNKLVNDTIDYWELIPYGSSYEIKDIKATAGHTYNGVVEGNLKGTMTEPFYHVDDGEGNEQIMIFLDFTTNAYTLTFNGNGGVSFETTRSVKYNTTFGKLPTATRDGYTFKGWNTKADGTGTTVTASTKMGITDTTIYAQWTANSYTATFDANGGSTASPSTITKTYNAELGTLPTTSRTGYTFKGWYTAKSGGTKISTTTKMGASNITYYAQWSINSYIATFDANGGSTASPSTITKKVNEALGELPTTSRTGYTFNGWYTAKTGGTKISSATKMNASNVTYYAQWIANNYTVTFDANGGSAASPSTITKDCDTELGTLPTTSRTGYTFNGWYTAKTGGTKISATTKMGAGNVTYYAQWTINQYTLTFDANGGTSSESSRKLSYNAAYGTLPTVNRTGYEFNGWYTAKTGGTKVTAETKMGTSNTTVYAQWTINSYTATFNANGGGTVSPSTITKSYNSELGTLPTVSRTGYTFNGWYTAKTGGTKISATTKLTANVTYYAQWTVNNYTATFDANGGGTVSPSTITKAYNAELGTLPTVSRTGYTFNGWFTEKTDGSQISATTKMGAGSVTYYAQWTINQYTATFDANGGMTTEPESITLNYNEELGELPVTGREGHTFNGWYTAKTGGTQISEVTKMGAGNVTYYAQWTANSYTATFNANGGGTVSPSTITKAYNAELGTLPTVSRTGYTFKGWFTTSSGGTKITEATKMGSENITYYAQWTANTYTVAFNGNGATSGSMNNQKFTYDVAQNLTANAYGRSYTVTYNYNGSGAANTTATATATFNGWATSASGAKVYNDKQSVSNLATSGTFTLYANWTLGKVTLPSPTRTGYTFTGWNTKADGTGTNYNGGSQYTPSANTTLYAQWKINSYTATFNANGGTTANPQTITKNYNAELGTLPTTSRTGYTFNGWYTAASGGTKISTTTKMGASNVTYYAQWTINSYTATFDANGGTTASPSTITKNYNAELGTLPTTSRTGYTFNGWYTAKSGGTKISTTTKMGAGNVTYYAQWTVNSYTLTFNGNGGTPSESSRKVNYNAAYGTLPTASRTGYTFNGWYTATSGGTKVSDTTKMGTSNTTVYAQWTINSYTATFNANGGGTVTPATITKSYGSQLGTLPTVSRTGYTFKGWFTATSGGSQISTTTTITGNVTYYAQWTVNNYTATFNANGGGTVSPATITKSYGSQLGTLPTVSRTGYTFKGWFTATSGGTQISTTTTMGASNVTYYAQWTANTYTVAFNGNGATSGSMNNQGFTYGVAQNLSANAYGRSYTVTYNYNGSGAANTTATATSTFNGWATSSGGSKVYSDKQSVSNLATSGTFTLYANWTLGKVTLPSPTRTGYTFNGWNTKSDGSGTAYSGGTAYTPSANVTLYAQWKINSYTATFNANGGGTVSPATITKTYGSQLGTLPTVSRTGYTFNGWYTATSGGTKISSTTTITANVTYYAQWTKSSYFVTHDANDGSGQTVRAEYAGGNTNVTLQPANIFSRTGYTLSSWNTKADGSGTSYAPGATIECSSTLTLYAQWTVNTYTNTIYHWRYVGTGGNNWDGTMYRDPNEDTTFTGAYGTNVTLPAGHVKSYTGYYNNGKAGSDWGGTEFYNKDIGTTFVQPEGGIVIEYYYHLNSYTVTYNANGGSGSMSNSTATYNQDFLTRQNAFTRAGYTFTGWNESADGTGVAWGLTSSGVYENGKAWKWTYTKNITLYAQWKLTASASAKSNLKFTGGSITGVTGSNVTWTGTTSATTPGTYTAYATPNSGCVWSDGTNGKKTITWTINGHSFYTGDKFTMSPGGSGYYTSSSRACTKGTKSNTFYSSSGYYAYVGNFYSSSGVAASGPLSHLSANSYAIYVTKVYSGYGSGYFRLDEVINQSR